ncbi:hypothetical protein BGW36DRAFT_426527 [Talaromyces proteolyticus]|uniref:Uncharacterized protein n=1 Tax=Talaromyces proteolyticus TaxID=1131652 RepID=A0AAD4KTB2_9EURO|nr:uncharacterized protein BGW36DRAFT_426527 [Talaromyces proteolyticus]KAH8698837.1 hypothetical protein BGW36DRAFT_426527 [Talaromyces proteolyticus]
MGQRHNRRRTRPRSRNRSLTDDLHHLSGDESSPATSPSLASVYPVPLSVVIEPAAHPWHIGFDEWRGGMGSDPTGIDAEQYRLFGGVPGDDPSLCNNMLEYFDHLDYIDT